MSENEFWVEPIALEGHVATVHASFNAFSVTVRVERTDGVAISEAEAEMAYHAVLARVPIGSQTTRLRAPL